MNLVLVWFIIYLSLSTEARAHAVFYADEIPEEYVTEQMVKRFPQRGRHRHFNSGSAISEHTPDSGLTYRFQGRSSSSGNISPSEDSPSNPYHYEDKQSLTDNVNVNPQVFSSESESDEDYDRFALEPNPQHQILESPQQAEEETSNEEAEIEASNVAETYSSEETDPENYHPCNTTDQADPENKVVSEETDPESYHPCNTTAPPVPDNEFDTNTVILVVCCSVAAVILVTTGGVIWYTLCKKAKAGAHVKGSANRRKKNYFREGNPGLEKSAEIYHFLHQKRNLIAMESSNPSVSETDSEAEREMILFEHLK
jgi:hypothetical protein